MATWTTMSDTRRSIYLWRQQVFDVVVSSQEPQQLSRPAFDVAAAFAAGLERRKRRRQQQQSSQGDRVEVQALVHH